jgi:hypothetical protein
VEGGLQHFENSVPEFTRQIEEHSEETVRTGDILNKIKNVYLQDTRDWSFLFTK